jgi:hypothetical protein
LIRRIDVLGKLITWWNKRTAEAEDRDYMSGYEYAAGQLLRFNGPKEEMVNRLEDESSGLYDRTNFDKGMGAALCDWAAAFDKED